MDEPVAINQSKETNENVEQDTKYAICVTKEDGSIYKEYPIANTLKRFEKLADADPKALIALEVSKQSP